MYEKWRRVEERGENIILHIKLQCQFIYLTCRRAAQKFRECTSLSFRKGNLRRTKAEIASFCQPPIYDSTNPHSSIPVLIVELV
jgi:hypothetical protein